MTKTAPFTIATTANAGAWFGAADSVPRSA
jgi:hypothetical protein